MSNQQKITTYFTHIVDTTKNQKTLKELYEDVSLMREMHREDKEMRERTGKWF